MGSVLQLNTSLPLLLAPMIQSDISMEDFDLVVDEVTGESVLRLKPEAAIRKGLTSLLNTNFEVVIDPMTGQPIIRIKEDSLNRKDGARVEIVTDAVTGKQTIRMVTDDDSNEVGEGKWKPINR